MEAQEATQVKPTLIAPQDPPARGPDVFTSAQSVFQGRFELEQAVAGSRDRVLFVARDLVLKRRVALRVHLTPGGRNRKWFERETEVLATLDHPSIRSVYAAGYEGEWAYRVSKWIEGESLADAVARGPRSIPLVLHLARHLMSAIEYAHSERMVLRRIIPTTVMLDQTLRVVITDLRYANRCLKLADPDQDKAATPFLAPEAWHGHYGEPGSDVYAVGALLYFALTGQPPASNPKDIILPSELRPNSPQLLDRMIMRATAQDPRDRYLSAADMAEHLASELGEFEAPVAMPAPGASREDPDAWEKQLRRALGDQYELLEEVGVGGFGSVYRVLDLSLEREVALKVLHPYLTADRKVVERFRTEAQLAAKLDHANIVSIYGIGSRAGLLWYTMEYIAGWSLAQLIHLEGPLTLSRWTTMMEQILGALQHAHSHDLVHRDLKPENILIDAHDLSVEITDFGLALALHDKRHRIEESHSGTPEFAAPEQMLGEPVDHRADLYAVSLVGYYALTGRLPFEGGTVESVLARKSAGELPRVQHFRDDVSDALFDVLKRGASRDPDERYASAAEYAASLRAATRASMGTLRERLRGLFGNR